MITRRLSILCPKLSPLFTPPDPSFWSVRVINVGGHLLETGVCPLSRSREWRWGSEEKETIGGWRITESNQWKRRRSLGRPVEIFVNQSSIRWSPSLFAAILALLDRPEGSVGKTGKTVRGVSVERCPNQWHQIGIQLSTAMLAIIVFLFYNDNFENKMDNLR